MNPLWIAAGGLAAWEAAWWARRRARRTEQFARAQQAAKELRRPLVVIGAPDGGVTAGYGCGDVTVDIVPSACPNAVRADVTRALPFATNSSVVYCSCVLEYVGDAHAAVHEILRVSGGWAYFCGVEPWTLTSVFYPGARRTLPPALR